jgi:phage antirepressor YoqD-like protein
VIDRGRNLCLRETAKALGVKQTVFIQYLINHGYIYHNDAGNILPYAGTEHLFTVKEFMASQGHNGLQTLVTPQGRVFFNQRFNRSIR